MGTHVVRQDNRSEEIDGVIRITEKTKLYAPTLQNKDTLANGSTGTLKFKRQVSYSR